MVTEEYIEGMGSQVGDRIEYEMIIEPYRRGHNEHEGGAAWKFKAGRKTYVAFCIGMLRIDNHQVNKIMPNKELIPAIIELARVAIEGGLVNKTKLFHISSF